MALCEWIEVRALSRNDSASDWKFISEDILSRFGIVNKFVADRGEVSSNLIKKLANKYGLKISSTTSYHSQSNVLHMQSLAMAKTPPSCTVGGYNNGKKEHRRTPRT
ncbi:hypothetical protein AYI69_g6144, partial [Smittium culicis]